MNCIVNTTNRNNLLVISVDKIVTQDELKDFIIKSCKFENIFKLETISIGSEYSLDILYDNLSVDNTFYTYTILLNTFIKNYLSYDEQIKVLQMLGLEHLTYEMFYKKPIEF